MILTAQNSRPVLRIIAYGAPQRPRGLHVVDSTMGRACWSPITTLTYTYLGLVRSERSIPESAIVADTPRKPQLP